MRPISSYAAAAIALAALTAGAQAANPGSVRITDRASAAVNVSPASYGSYTGAPVGSYGDCNECPPGHGCCMHGCNPLACAHCLATYPCHRLSDALHSYIGVTQSLAQADGIYRLPVHYQRFWPTHWYGQPGAVYAPTFPMVYMPTDTTQLGFYYQRVPYWQPRPAMLSAAGIAAGGAVGMGAGGAVGGYIESPGVIGPHDGTMDHTPPPPAPPAEASNASLRSLLGLN